MATLGWDQICPLTVSASRFRAKFAVFRGRVLKRIMTNCLLQENFVSLVLVSFGALLIDLKIYGLRCVNGRTKKAIEYACLLLIGAGYHILL